MNINSKKQVYSAPQINRIELDNEISLTLDSTPDAPPSGPGGIGKAPEYFNNEPFKTNLG